MLQNLRNYFPKWLVATLLGLLGLLLVLGGLYGPSDVASWSARKVLVRINGKKIRLFQVERLYNAVKQQAAAEGNVSFTSGQERELRTTILQQLTLMELIKQHADTYGYRVHPNDALAMVRSMPNLQVDGRFSPQHFKALLAAVGMTKAAFLKEVAADNLTGQALGAMRRSAFIFSKEVNQFVRLSEQERDFSYIELEARHFAPDKAELSVEEVKAYYDQHLTQFRVPEQVSIDYILLSRADMLDKFKESYKNDRQALEAKVTQSFEAAVNQLSELNSKHNDSLAETAKALAVDVQSTALFGREGGAHIITKQPEVIAAAFSEPLRKRRNSAPIRVDEDRVVVLRLKEYQPLRLAAFTEVESVAREQLAVQKGKEAVQQYGEQLVEKCKKNLPESTDAPEHFRWKTVEKAKRDNQDVNLEILAKLFAMSYHKGATPVRGASLSNGNYVIIRLFKVRPGKPSQLESEQRDTYRQGLLTKMNELDRLQYVQASEEHVKLRYAS